MGGLEVVVGRLGCVLYLSDVLRERRAWLGGFEVNRDGDRDRNRNRKKGGCTARLRGELPNVHTY